MSELASHLIRVHWRNGKSWWALAETDFLIFRSRREQPEAPFREEGRYWRVCASSEISRELLERYGLLQGFYPTRREALQRLQDILKLEGVER